MPKTTSTPDAPVPEHIGPISPILPILPISPRYHLIQILESHGVSVAGFDALRSDAYEKHLARRSLADLERLYEVLCGSARGYEEIISECPRWEAEQDEDKRAGKLPHRTTLSDIRQRLRNEQSAREKLAARGFATSRRPEDEPPFDARVYHDTVQEVLGEELIGAKLDGKPLSENLKVVDKFLKAGSLQVRQHREAREEARFTWERQGKEIEEKPRPPQPGSELVRLSPAELEVLGRLRVMCMIEGIYGKPPEAIRQRDIKEFVDDMKASVAEDPGKALVDGQIPASMTLENTKASEPSSIQNPSIQPSSTSFGVPASAGSASSNNLTEAESSPAVLLPREREKVAGGRMRVDGEEHSDRERTVTNPSAPETPNPKPVPDPLPDLTRVKIELKRGDLFPQGLGRCQITRRNVDLATGKYLPNNWREQLEKNPGMPLSDLVPGNISEPEEVTPDMRHVVYTAAPCAKYPEGRGRCIITDQSVDIANERYLSQEWTKHRQHDEDLKRLAEAKKMK